MKKIDLAGLALVGMAIVVPAAAQKNFGELLDMGATKVSKLEWDSVLPASVRAPGQQGDAILFFRPGGKLDGQYTLRANGVRSRVIGTWTMDGQGKLCIDEHLVDLNTTHKDCWFMYNLKGTYTGTKADSDRPDRAHPLRNPLITYEIRLSK